MKLTIHSYSVFSLAGRGATLSGLVFRCLLDEYVISFLFLCKVCVYMCVYIYGIVHLKEVFTLPH